jgi:hypothetical protein
MAKRKIKTGLESLPGYVRPLRPKEKVDLAPNEYSVAREMFEDIVDHFDNDQIERTARWRKNEKERASESERRRRAKRQEEQ